MQVTDYSTGSPIPYATVSVAIPGLPDVGIATDGNGELPNSWLNPFLGRDITISSAGYKSKTVSANSLINLGGVELEEGGSLPEVFVTAIRKVKENPKTVIAIVLVVVLVIVFRKQIFGLLKK